MRGYSRKKWAQDEQFREKEIKCPIEIKERHSIKIKEVQIKTMKNLIQRGKKMNNSKYHVLCGAGKTECELRQPIRSHKNKRCLCVLLR